MVARGVMLKGATLDVLCPSLLTLFALLLFGVSVGRFRKQLDDPGP
ncbi:MAG TPA: hypothetical protein VGX48_10535 [Pyrinomonadaceae bacterium]|jgi:hypothetical protein|nr:hypothetical protein [Pyrinomonadaceae bacterium]